MRLADRLSHLSYRQAVSLLGKSGAKLIQAGGSLPIDVENQVTLEDDLLEIRFGRTRVRLESDPGARGHIGYSCSACEGPCEQVGAAFSLVLEEKTLLGLAAPPAETVPLEHLNEAELEQRALSERMDRARKEKMRLHSMDPARLWTDYVITSEASGKVESSAANRTAPAPTFAKTPSAPVNISCTPWTA